MDKEKKFTNTFPNFSISGKYKGSRITEIDTDAAFQSCSSGVDFVPKWKVRGNKLVLELTPRWITEDEDKPMKLLDQI